MTLRSPEWYRRQADKMLEQAEIAERVAALVTVVDELPHGTVVTFTKEYSAVGVCVYAAVRVQTESGRGAGWYRTGRHSSLDGMTSYSSKALLEWIGAEHVGTLRVMEPGRSLLAGEENSA